MTFFQKEFHCTATTRNQDSDPETPFWHPARTNSEMHKSFFDSARNASWNAIKDLGDKLKCRMLNIQNERREEKKHTQDLEATNQHLREDIIDLALESCDQDRQIASKDALIDILTSE